jgi:hypothetical protein
MSEPPNPNQLTFFAGDGPVKTSRWLDSVLDWLESDPVFSMRSFALLVQSLPAGFSSKTSLDFVRLGPHLNHRVAIWGLDPNGRPKRKAICNRSYMRLSNSGMAWPGGVLTLNTTLWPSDGSVCSLSDVLETGPVPQKFFLSPKACRGILRRAEKRGRALPGQLEKALEAVACRVQTKSQGAK